MADILRNGVSDAERSEFSVYKIILIVLYNHVKNVIQFFSKYKMADRMKNTVQALKYPSAHTVTLYMPCFRQLIENNNDLIKLIKPKWPPQPRFQFHMKTDNSNRLADPENLYIYQVSREF